jgi:hypothetical protein
LLNFSQFVDGWELNHQFFPSLEDHPKPLNQRYQEFCGQHKVKEVLESSQNAGLVQYRMPGRGRGFSFTLRFLRNPTRKSSLLGKVVSLHHEDMGEWRYIYIHS